jgi:DNA-binding NarL/FixJ family response regulator
MSMIESPLSAAIVPQSPIRIVLVEDHIILRDGLKALIEIEPDCTVVGEFTGVDQCLAGIDELQPDLVLTDLELPERSGIELLARITRLVPKARKLVLTVHDGEEHVRAALHAGADGYVLKDADRDELVLAIRTVLAGQQFLCEAVANKVLCSYLSGGASHRSAAAGQNITGREREVLTRIALGESNKIIARSLALSVKTIEKHRSNLMRKLNLHNAAAITLFAVRNGFTGEPESIVQFDTALQRNASVS